MKEEMSRVSVQVKNSAMETNYWHERAGKGR